MRSRYQSGYVFSGLLLALVTLSDSWIVSASVAPVSASGPKHEILVVRRHLRRESTRTDRLPLAARFPQVSGADEPRFEPLQAVPVRPDPVDPASWLGIRHLRSPS